MTKLAGAIERRERPTARAGSLAPAEEAADGPRPALGPRKVPAWAVGVLVGGTVLAMIVAALVRDSSSVAARPSGPTASAEDPLAFFEQRVREHPDDVAARLDLAHRYLDLGRADEALEEYAVALELDPDDAEAHAHVGLILYGGGRIEEALASVDRALATDPAYPEALLIRGVILLEGLDRPREAIVAFEGYLDAAPFGSARGNVEGLILQAEAALAGRGDQGST